MFRVLKFSVAKGGFPRLSLWFSYGFPMVLLMTLSKGLGSHWNGRNVVRGGTGEPLKVEEIECNRLNIKYQISNTMFDWILFAQTQSNSNIKPKKIVVQHLILLFEQPLKSI